MEKHQLISIITPVYNEEHGVLHFFDQICGVLHKLPYRFEIIIVDDGSSDDSAAKILSLKNKKNVVVVPLRFSRNFGKETAVTAGLHKAKGDAAIILDSDLQHPVEKIPDFLAKWRDGADVVIGVRGSSGKNSIIKSISSKIFYMIINSISETHIVPHSTDYRLLDRVVIDEFNRFTERHRITRGLIDWLGFDREIVVFEAKKRQFGTPSYSYKMLIQLAVTSFVTHSIFPLRLAGYVGFLMMLVSGLLGMFVMVEQFMFGDALGLAVSGTAMVSLVVLFVCGIILVSLGLMSLYIGMMHGESLNRPLYVLRKQAQGRRGR